MGNPRSALRREHTRAAIRSAKTRYINNLSLEREGRRLPGPDRSPRVPRPCQRSQTGKEREGVTPEDNFYGDALAPHLQVTDPTSATRMQAHLRWLGNPEIMLVDFALVYRVAKSCKYPAGHDVYQP